MKAAEVRERSTDELKTQLDELRRELWRARFDNHTNSLDDTSKIKRLRRDLARVKTILTQREQ
ncbi:MAG: 50S ribosomal protein L29 [Polyangiaceae bacterium]|nr:50S ribosomal protein L29 [Polyangiaceae bacterium]